MLGAPEGFRTLDPKLGKVYSAHCDGQGHYRVSDNLQFCEFRAA